MHRECTNCRRPFRSGDFVKEQSKGMEADRKSLGLEGVRFLYYSCPACGYDDIFLDVHPLHDEFYDDFYRRREQLEQAVREFHADRIDAVVCERSLALP